MPAPDERGCLGRAYETAHFRGNPMTFYPSLILTCITGLGGIFQVSINILRIIFFWLQMFMLQSYPPLSGQKCVTFKEKHTHKHTCTYSYNMCNEQNWFLYLAPATTGAWGQNVFTPVLNHSPPLPSQPVPVDSLPIYPDVTKHCSVTHRFPSHNSLWVFTFRCYYHPLISIDN